VREKQANRLAKERGESMEIIFNLCFCKCREGLLLLHFCGAALCQTRPAFETLLVSALSEK